jgi:hypothetical protein
MEGVSSMIKLMLQGSWKTVPEMHHIWQIYGRSDAPLFPHNPIMLLFVFARFVRNSVQ